MTQGCWDAYIYRMMFGEKESSPPYCSKAMIIGTKSD